MKAGDEVRWIGDLSETFVIQAIVIHDVYGCETAEVQCNDTGLPLWIPCHVLELVA